MNPIPFPHADEEIPQLIETLVATERRLVELTAGEVDAVAGREGHTFLLQRAQDQLRLSDISKQQSILNALPAHIALLDAQGAIISVNEQWRQFGRSEGLAGPPKGEGVNYLAICDETEGPNKSDAQAAAAGIRAVLANTARSFSMEYACHLPTEKCWFLMTVTPLTDDHLHGVVVMHINITDRKQAEVVLQASEHRFKTLFEQAAVGVALIAATTGQFVQVNQRFADIIGRSRRELEELKFTDVTHVEDMEADLEMMQRLRAGTVRESAREKRYLRQDGSEVWVSLTVSAMWVAGEEPSLCIKVVQDITERKQMEEQLRHAHKMEAIGTLAGGIAHDFNNILAAIGGYTEVARMKLKDNPDVRANLDSVMKAMQRGADLVRQILTFSREQPLERRLISLQPVVTECVELLRATLPTSIELKLEVAEDAPPVLADETQVLQVLMNLGTNARQALGDQTGHIRVKVENCVFGEARPAALSRLRAGRYASVSVSDTGSGMDPKTLQRIFEPFFTTKAPDKGTGLGLAVVHGIMEGHDGLITVDSQPGKGTTFHLYFPAHHAGMVLVPPPKETGLHGRPLRVLVVDDEKLFIEVIRWALVDLGYEVEAVTQPAAALELARTAPARFAIVITDQVMPGMTGLELAVELRKIRPDLPIILTTGHKFIFAPESIKAAGVGQLLHKPISLETLGSAMKAALNAQPFATHFSNPPF